MMIIVVGNNEIIICLPGILDGIYEEKNTAGGVNVNVDGGDYMDVDVLLHLGLLRT